MAKLSPNTPAVSAIVAVERARISSIVNSEVGKSRRDAALQLALNTDLTTDTVLDLLAKMPEDASSKFLMAMEREAVNFTGNTGAASMNSDPKAARLEELKGSMKAFNHAKGYTVKLNED
ncbi:hypothetical protein FNL56_21495 [Tardiphaga sp. vice304]|uniref:hypothetical protein n=1 Tax=Tardiphaga sp. vice304 TaxID=2592817 RepID=UPI001164C6E0|nr:hypothetical protein [Tardiphaga sp. vice304]QDM28398.1 hypothetical protein FNL56_21495 [Tardiphaga sp. vice304]